MSDEGKEYKCCPHCDTISELTHFTWNDYKGDGNCKKCHGEGEIDNSLVKESGEFFESLIAGDMANTKFPATVPCHKCSGTGQCQTCGGCGRVKRKRFEADNGSKDDDVEEEYDEDEGDDEDEEDEDDYDYYNDDDDADETDDDYTLNSITWDYQLTTPANDNPIIKYCSLCGSRENSNHDCIFPNKHTFITGYSFDYCSKCGITAGSGYSKCHFPYSNHDFVKGNNKEYCEKCGTIPLSKVTECHFPYNRHSFIIGNPDNYKCSRCQMKPGKLTKCSFPYDNHNFINLNT